MKLIVIAGTGTGANDQAAYEAALSNAEASDYEVPGECSVGAFARSLMAQSQPGRWAHAALGWLHDPRAVQDRFITLQDENLEQLQRRLRTAAHELRHDREQSKPELHSRFASIVCRGDPVCALIMAGCREAMMSCFPLGSR